MYRHDKQPSEQNVYPHTRPVPAVYARSTDGLRVSGKVTFVSPYSRDKNEVFESENTHGADVRIEVG